MVQVPIQFEIKIAVIGPVSAGKSTLINALLVGKYSEMATRRTTAGVNYFRLHGGLAKENAGASKSEDDTPSSASSSWTQVVDTPMKAAEIHSQISKDNQELRKQTEVVERTFDVEGIELVRNLREDTRIVLVDIPGMNEADSSSKYKDYVKNHWKTFDMVILVMDGRQGVNSEEQVALLQFVKDNQRPQSQSTPNFFVPNMVYESSLQKLRNIPTIVLLNKADDMEAFPDVIAETKAKIASMFAIPDGRDLASELAVCKEDSVPLENLTHDSFYIPVVVPFSARNAYLFRLASTLEAEKFKNLEPGLVDVLGKEQIGLRRWNKLSHEERLQEAFEAITDPDVYTNGLQTSNYETLERVINAYFGTTEHQKRFLLETLDIRRRELEPNGSLAKNVEYIFRAECQIKEVKLNTIPSSLHLEFWKHWEYLEENALSGFGILWKSTNAIEALHILIEYHKLVQELKSSDEAATVICCAVDFIKDLVKTTIREWRADDCGIRGMLAIEDALTLSARQAFMDHFRGVETVLRCSSHILLAEKYVDSPASFCFRDIVDLFDIPNLSPSDKDHGGYIFWVFCEWIECLDK